MIATQQQASPAVEGKAGVSATSDTVCGPLNGNLEVL